MTIVQRFAPGAPIAHRSVDLSSGTVMTVLGQIVVRDDPQVIATYMPLGSATKRRSGDRGAGPRGRQMLRWDGGYVDRPWERTSVLMIHRPGDGFSLWYAWDPADWRLAWLYVNLEEPWRHTRIGFDSRDLWLDLWARPGCAEWHWKDEDELAWAVDAGQCSAARAAAIRAEGERAVALITRREPPFDDEWRSWRPDPRWAPPDVPPDWNSFHLPSSGSHSGS